MSTPPPALVALLITTSIAVGCGDPPDAARGTLPGDERSDTIDVPGPRTARRAPAAVEPASANLGTIVPAPASASANDAPPGVAAISEVTSNCASDAAGTVATVGYRSSRGSTHDEVELTFRSDNGYVDLTHRRGGHDLGTTRVDVVFSDSPRFPAIAGSGAGQSALITELPAADLRGALVAAGVCLSQSMEGQVRRNDEIYIYLPSCDFPERLVDTVLATAVEGATRACCASALGDLRCQSCQAGASAARQAFDRERASAPAAGCDGSEPSGDGH